MHTQVCIVGGGPSGLLLSRLLRLQGIDTVVLERQTREHVLGRIRAGVLEWGSVGLLHRAGIGARMEREGFVHRGIYLSARNRGFRIPFDDLTDKKVMIYGQTEVTADLYAAADAAGDTILHEVEDVTIEGADGDAPAVMFRHAGEERRIACDYVAGCDGFHGVSRRTIPAAILTEYERVYPFGWLGILSETPPVADELIYANHSRGFALCSMRNEALSRHYIQVPASEDPAQWSDAGFWDELRRRIPDDAADALVTGPSIEKSVARLRSYVAEPMRWGRLLLAGDAAHVVPPTGAKGLNLAFSDVHYLSEALIAWYNDGDARGLDTYSDTALARVWKAIRFSWWFTTTMHRFPEQSPFDQKIQESEIDYLEQSDAAKTMLAEQYVGLPY